MALQDDIAAWIQDGGDPETETTGFRVAFVNEQYFCIERRTDSPNVLSEREQRYYQEVIEARRLRDAAIAELARLQREHQANGAEPVPQPSRTIGIDAVPQGEIETVKEWPAQMRHFTQPIAREHPAAIQFREGATFDVDKFDVTAKPQRYANPDVNTATMQPGDCSVCSGTGKMRDNSHCRTCDGSGKRG